MPHKYNSDRRHKITKQKFQVTNWSTYNESLRQRGELTVWLSDEALCLWLAPRRTSRGGHEARADRRDRHCDGSTDQSATRIYAASVGCRSRTLTGSCGGGFRVEILGSVRKPEALKQEVRSAAVAGRRD